MLDLDTWQAQALMRLSERFEKDAAVRALVLTGSLADAAIPADAWSDIDVKVVLADQAVDTYYASVEWLRDFGRLIGVERHEGRFAKTLRVCLEDFQRFDLVFVAESALQNPTAWEPGLFQPPRVVLWSRIPDLEALIATHAYTPVYQDISEAELECMVDRFWFKAAIAISKVVREDLLIGLHLALGLARDCLVLQMIRRDREKGNNIHRVGGWGNALVTRLSYENHKHTAEAILDLVQQSCEVFDELAMLLSPNYKPRGSLLSTNIEAARERVTYYRIKK